MRAWMVLLMVALFVAGCEESEESTSTATTDNSTGDDQSVVITVDGSNNTVQLNQYYEVEDPGDAIGVDEGEAVSGVVAAMILEVGGKVRELE